MDIFASAHVKQNFGEVLARAALAPVGVQRHGKWVAGLVPASWLVERQMPDERLAARAAQRQVEAARLMAHQRLGIELLGAQPQQAQQKIQAACHEVARWEARQLCSADYIARWREWLALPLAQLVPTMCGEAHGWGIAMRQNSPFSGATPTAVGHTSE